MLSLFWPQRHTLFYFFLVHPFLRYYFFFFCVVAGKNKYVFTSMESIFKSKSDESKFDLARKLKRKVNGIRQQYETQLDSDDNRTRQLATALYFIDHLALRVGGKKDSKEEADTVGVTSLRVEHINLSPPNVVKLDFLAKDSVRFCKRVNV